MAQQQQALVPLTIVMGDQQRVTLELQPGCTTLAQLRAEVEVKVQVPQPQQRLIYSGQELNGTGAELLSSFGVGDHGTFIHLVRRAAVKGKPAAANVAAAAPPMVPVAIAPAGSSCGAAGAGAAAAAVAAPAAAAAAVSPAAAGKRRKRATGDGGSAKKPKAPVEKRAARFRGSCPQSLQDRIHRAATQRMFLIDRQDLTQEGDLRQQFTVLGSTGNVYRVGIGQVPTCDCPDRSALCKHIVFVYLKVLKQSLESPHIYQAALLQSELKEIFDAAPPSAADVLANQRVRQEYDKATGKAVDGEEPPPAGRAVDAEDECPICFEALLPDAAAAAPPRPLACCTGGCGKSLHQECQRMWAMAEANNGRAVTCPYCRQPWVGEGGGGAAAGAAMVEGYINMAATAGLPTERDTSTYNPNWNRRSRGGRW